MKNYKGVTNEDIPTGAGSYVEENQDGGEVNNFYPLNGNYYGYARIQNGRSLRIEKLGADLKADFIDNITVVLFAKNPETGGQYIVGWYKNAKLFRHIQELKSKIIPNKPYNVITEIGDGFLLKPSDRIFAVEGPGQTNAWYVEEYVEKSYFLKLEEYMADPENYLIRIAKKKRGNRAWQKDIELRKKVEYAAMDAVAAYFEVRNYEVSFCHKENYGWDMEASSGKQKLLLEVKGLSGEFNVIELTNNEYKNSKLNRKHYRICIVTNCLDTNKIKVNIYFNENGNWVSKENKILKIQESTSALFYNQN
jgi:hypothetical protein